MSTPEIWYCTCRNCGERFTKHSTERHRVPCPACESLDVQDSDEPWGAGADPFGRPDPSTLIVLEEEREELLTAREREVLSWVARGKTNADIARLLWIAPGTVRKHLENVYAKLGVRTRTAAVTRFLGLVDEAEASSG